MDAETIIRYATLEDASALRKLARDTFDDSFSDHPLNSPEDMRAYMETAFSLERTKEELADPNAIFLIAESEVSVVDGLRGEARGGEARGGEATGREGFENTSHGEVRSGEAQGRARVAVGYAKLLIDSRESQVSARRPIELCRIYVSHEVIGRRLGSALMQRCIDEAKRAECDVIWLGVWEHNEKAQRFYARWGFVDVGTHTFQLGADAQTDRVMQRSIE